jgi:hypothetical protein
VPAVATLLTELRWLHEDGLLDDASYAATRALYEKRLAGLRAATNQETGIVPAAGPADRSGPPAGSRRSGGLLRRVLDPDGAGSVAGEEPPIPRLPAPPRPSLGEWAAARQADILLYLGAFILSIAALIFVGYQGEALTGWGRLLALFVYTVAFLVLGLLLPRWDRVREAGPVFLALGALLVPVNVIALRTQVLDEGTLPDDLLWLIGGALTAALYLALALRGHGRLYAIPGAIAGLIAWGALRSVLGIPDEWAGAWFVAGAAVVGIIVEAMPIPAAHWLRMGALVVGGAGLIAAHLFGLDEGRDTAQLPVAYVLATAGVAGSLYRRRTVVSWALLPALASMTALTAWWSAFGLPVAWWGVFIAGAAFGYLAVAELDYHRRSRRWCWTAAAPTALALLLLHASEGAESARVAFPITYALVFLVALTAYLRGRWPEALATLPPLAAALGASLTWAVLDHHRMWFAPWAAAAGLGYLAIAERAPQRRTGGASERDWWRAAAGVAGALALVMAYSRAGAQGAPEWHLPATYAVLLTGAAWETLRGRTAGTLLLPVLVALFGVSALDALDVARVWWSYPGLVVAVLVLLAEPWWQTRPAVRDVGWQELLVGTTAVPLMFLPLYSDDPAHGVVGFTVAAAVYLVAALRADGAVARMFGDPPTDSARLIERQMLARASGALLYAAAGFLNAALGVTDSDRAWVFLGIGMAEWLGLTLFGGRRGLFGVLMPGAVVALVIAASIARDDAGLATLIGLVGAAGAALAFSTTRRWSLWAVCASFTAATLAFFWKWRALDWATLPILYGTLAGAACGVLAPLRRYERGERGVVVTLLTWGSWIVALAAALIALAERREELFRQTSLVGTKEWASLAIVTAAMSTVLAAEGARLRSRGIIAAGSAGLLLALLLAIAILEPENIQAYTLPAGLYLIGLGMAWRRSGELLGRHMLAHEAVQVLGMLVLLLPPAEQSFAPDGGRFGLELIAAGLLLLAVGLALYARWLVVGGVLTLTAVAVRWLVTESDVPYWLTLGVVGMVLLAFGTLLLLERDRWDRARERMRRWWAGGPMSYTE